MTEVKIEIGDNLKEVMLALLEASSIKSGDPIDFIRPSIALREAFNLDFGKILKNLGRRVQIINTEE